MSVYGVSKLCHLANVDAAFRDRLSREPEAVLEGLPLSAEEKRALLAGDVGWLHGRGVHGYLLGHLARLGLFGLTDASYRERMREAARSSTDRPGDGASA